MDGISFQLFHKELDELNILCQRLSYSRVLSLIDEASSFQKKDISGTKMMMMKMMGFDPMGSMPVIQDHL